MIPPETQGLHIIFGCIDKKSIPYNNHKMEGLTYNLLVVDRQAESRGILKGIFDEEGFRYDFLQSGESAFLKFMKQHYDLIISEIDLGEGQMSGLK